MIVGNKTQQLSSLALLLQRFAYEVTSVSTAAHARGQASVTRPALIVSEPILPDMDGLDFFRMLRQERRTASIPVVMLIPPSDAALEKRCLDSGVAACITKPILAEDLYRTVQAAVEPRPRADFRIDARLPVSVNNVRLCSTEGECEVDLSEHGMYVPMPKPYPKNRRITVRFHIKDRTISATGAVLHSHTSAEGPSKEPGMGLKFINMAPQDREFIRAFVRAEVTRGIRAASSRGSAYTV